MVVNIKGETKDVLVSDSWLIILKGDLWSICFWRLVNIEGRLIKYRYLFLTVGECRGYSNGVLVSVHYRLGRGSRPSAMVWSLTTVRSVPRNRSFYSIFTASWRGGTPPSAVSPRWASSKVSIPTVHHNHTATLYLGSPGSTPTTPLHCIWDSLSVLTSPSSASDVPVYS